MPARALAYRPLRSRPSQTSRAVARCTRTKPPCGSIMARTAWRAASYGAIGAQRAIPVGAGESELAGQGLAHQVAVQHGDRALAPLQEFGVQHPDNGRLPRAGKPGEEDRDALLSPGTVASPQLSRDLGEGDPRR